MRRSLLLLVFAAVAVAAKKSPAPLDAESVNRVAEEPITEGAEGGAVLRAQILLDRAHFSSGELDGHFGRNLTKAVAAYQRQRGIASPGGLDGVTWKSLNADTAPVLLPYTIAAADITGPFTPVPSDLMEQAKMASLGFESPLEALSEKFHASPKILSALNPGKDMSKEGETILVPNVLTMPPGRAARVEISKSDSSVSAYDEAGKLLAWYAASIGSEHDPLPVGDWKILGVARNPPFHYKANLFWDAKNRNDKAKIAPGPNNPVGVVWIDLSKDHYGIHGTPSPALVGHKQSHGCIRLTNWDAAELAAMVKPNTPATLKE